VTVDDMVASPVSRAQFAAALRSMGVGRGQVYELQHTPATTIYIDVGRAFLRALDLFVASPDPAAGDFPLFAEMRASSDSPERGIDVAKADALPDLALLVPGLGIMVGDPPGEGVYLIDGNHRGIAAQRRGLRFYMFNLPWREASKFVIPEDVVMNGRRPGWGAMFLPAGESGDGIYTAVRIHP
jgi:hypothetical protein